MEPRANPASENDPRPSERTRRPGPGARAAMRDGSGPGGRMTTRRRRTSKRTPEARVTTRPGAEGSVRWSRILSARARIEAGYYELDDVRESIVDALLEELARR